MTFNFIIDRASPLQALLSIEKNIWIVLDVNEIVRSRKCDNINTKKTFETQHTP